MRSLYLKIFLWFWAAMIVLVVAVTWTAGQVAERSGTERRGEWRAAGRATVQLRRVGEALAAHGPDAVARRLASDPRLGRLFVLGPDGRDLAGRELPDAARAAITGATPPRSAARILVGSASDGAGRPYRLLAVIAPPGAEGGRAPRRAVNPLRAFTWGSTEVKWARVAAAVLVSGLVCYLLAQYLTRPVARLRDATRQLASGDLATRVAPEVTRRRDELGGLGRDFDAMAARIEALLAARQRLLRDVSHELRSPLARLQVALGLARRRGVAAGAEHDRIELEAERLESLIGQVLALARLDSEPSGQDPVPVDLAALLRSVVGDADYEARARGRAVRVEAPGSALITGYPDPLRSALENVIRNAARHTAESTAVEASLEVEEALLRLRVRDHGPGVPEAALAHLFEPFYRVDDARGRAEGGHGIGLAIVERTVHRHGGEVLARNAKDGGLEIEIALPRAG